MSCTNRWAFSGLISATALLVPLTHASTIVPADPLPFESMHLRATVDSCSFNRGVSVGTAGGVIQVFEYFNACLLPGPPEVVDIQLGAYPPGTYRVDVFHSPQPGAEPAERLTFVVPDIVTVMGGGTAMFPRPPRPIADYSGQWWSPNQSGWGLSLHQGPLGGFFGTLSVFGVDRRAEWFTLQAGAWTSSTQWSGQVVKTTGPAWSVPPYDPRIVENAVVGTVNLDFAMVPGREDKARLSYTIGTTTVAVDIVRVRFLW